MINLDPILDLGILLVEFYLLFESAITSLLATTRLANSNSFGLGFMIKI